MLRPWTDALQNVLASGTTQIFTVVRVCSASMTSFMLGSASASTFAFAAKNLSRSCAHSTYIEDLETECASLMGQHHSSPGARGHCLCRLQYLNVRLVQGWPQRVQHVREAGGVEEIPQLASEGAELVQEIVVVAALLLKPLYHALCGHLHVDMPHMLDQEKDQSLDSSLGWLERSSWHCNQARVYRASARPLRTRSSGPALRCSLFWMVCLISCFSSCGMSPRCAMSRMRVSGVDAV